MIIPAKLARELEARFAPVRGHVNITIQIGGSVAKKIADNQAKDLRFLADKANYVFKGKTYALSMTHRTIIQWEDLSGLAFYVDAYRIFDRPSLKALSTFTFCLLAAAGFEGTQDEVAEHLAKNGTMKAALDAVSAAYIASQIPKDDLAERPPVPAK